jgi:hypothetical protein
LSGGGNTSLDVRHTSADSANTGIAAQNSDMIRPGMWCRKEHRRKHVMLNSQILEEASEIEAGNKSHFLIKIDEKAQSKPLATQTKPN